MIRICDYGCGKKAQYQLKNCKWCCSKSCNSCPEMRKKNSDAHESERNPFYGKKHTEKSKNLMSKARIGKHHTEETKEKQSKNHMGMKKPWVSERNKKYSGPLAPNWQGGISKFPYSFDWDEKVKNKVKERDNNECQNYHCIYFDCTNLDIHHIDYNKMNCDSTNLILLCDHCHGKTKSKNNKSYYQKFYEEIIKEKRKCLLESCLQHVKEWNIQKNV